MAPSPNSLDVIVIGDVNPDLILSGGDIVPRFGQVETLADDSDLTLGGSGAIVASGLARLGISTGMIGVIGDDPLGRFTLEALTSNGVDVSGVSVRDDVKTGVSVHLVAGDDRAIVTHLGSIGAMQLSDVDIDLLEAARHVHFAGVFLLEEVRPQLGNLMKTARANGATTSLDTNWDPSETWAIDDLLEQCDILLPNEGELLALSGATSVDQALDSLAERVATVVLKEGSRGGRVRLSSGSHSQPAPATEVVDAIGAGDSFDAGYIASHVLGETPEQALAMAVACGSLSVRRSGGTASQATWAEAEKLRGQL